MSVKVLLAEDDLVNQKVLSAMLELSGVTVEIASNGQEAVDKYSSGDFDLILMDCNMPVMDGYKACRTIRQLENADSHIPIIAITGADMADDNQTCLDAGMDDCLMKPIRRAALGELIEKWS